jgi:O-antigen ligase
MRAIVDRLDDVDPSPPSELPPGVFRSALWRDVLAATLDRPLRIYSPRSWKTVTGIEKRSRIRSTSPRSCHPARSPGRRPINR